MKGSGFKPEVSPHEITKNGNTFINVKIQVGDLYIKFDPVFIDKVIVDLEILRPGLIQRREDLVHDSRDRTEGEGSYADDY